MDHSPLKDARRLSFGALRTVSQAEPRSRSLPRLAAPFLYPGRCCTSYGAGSVRQAFQRFDLRVIHNGFSFPVKSERSSVSLFAGRVGAPLIACSGARPERRPQGRSCTCEEGHGASRVTRKSPGTWIPHTIDYSRFTIDVPLVV